MIVHGMWPPQTHDCHCSHGSEVGICVLGWQPIVQFRFEAWLINSQWQRPRRRRPNRALALAVWRVAVGVACGSCVARVRQIGFYGHFVLKLVKIFFAGLRPTPRQGSRPGPVFSL